MKPISDGWVVIPMIVANVVFWGIVGYNLFRDIVKIVVKLIQG